ncbi:MAG: hypothetical protein SGPRY_004016 [Prymnesium sp.]
MRDQQAEVLCTHRHRLRKSRWAEAVEACDAALAIDPCYVKALYRRAQGRRRLRQHALALSDCEQAMRVAAEQEGGEEMLRDIGLCLDAIKLEGGR